jgi:hypothetical protein
MNGWYALFAVALVGCGSLEKTFPERYIEKSCKFEKRCLTAAFYDTYTDKKDCVEENMGFWEDQEDLYDECDFSAEEARECLRGLGQHCKKAGRNLEAINRDCAEVWNCPFEGPASE